MKFKGIDQHQVLKTHAKSKALYPLHQGGVVVGHEVDDENRLVHVICNPDRSLRLAYASNERAAMQLPEPRFHRTVVTVGQPTVDKKSLQ